MLIHIRTLAGDLPPIYVSEDSTLFKLRVRVEASHNFGGRRELSFCFLTDSNSLELAREGILTDESLPLSSYGIFDGSHLGLTVGPLSNRMLERIEVMSAMLQECHYKSLGRWDLNRTDIEYQLIRVGRSWNSDQLFGIHELVGSVMLVHEFVKYEMRNMRK
jgi:hypothetical protein